MENQWLMPKNPRFPQHSPTSGSHKLELEEPAINLDVVGDQPFVFTENMAYRLDGDPKAGFKPVRIW